jgi:hypothetical protein
VLKFSSAIFIIHVALNQFAEKPDRVDELRAALRVIADARDSSVLSIFLDTGEVPGGLYGPSDMLVDSKPDM